MLADDLIAAEEQYQLGLAFEFGMNQQKIDYKAALELYDAASRQAHPKAQARAAALFAFLGSCSGIDSGASIARKLLQRSAARNDVSAKYQLAQWMLQGAYGSPINAKLAKQNLLQLLPELQVQAEAGYLAAQLHLIDIHKPASIWGMADPNPVKLWTLKAAEQGHLDCQLAVATAGVGPSASAADKEKGREMLKKIEFQIKG